MNSNEMKRKKQQQHGIYIYSGKIEQTVENIQHDRTNTQYTGTFLVAACMHSPT